MTTTLCSQRSKHAVVDCVVIKPSSSVSRKPSDS
jgi:hypothetical protein